MKQGRVVFLKLGGSLLSDKRKRKSFRAGTVTRLGKEIRRVLRADAALRLVIGPGARVVEASGS